MLHLALTVYSYSGGRVAPENTTFLATAAKCRIFNRKFFSQQPAGLHLARRGLHIALTVYSYSGGVVAPAPFSSTTTPARDRI